MSGTEKDYEELERLGAKLHIATPTAMWNFKLEAPDGGVVFDTAERAHSWVRNAYNFLVSNMCQVNANGTSVFGDGYINHREIGGSINGNGYPMCSKNSSAEAVGNGFIGAAGVASFGLVLGSGVTAYSFDDYKLATSIANGVGSGQLAYSLETVAKTWDSVNRKYNVVHSRVFNNNSSADVVVTEGGLISYINYDGGGYSSNLLFCRDVFETPFTIPAAYKFTATYTMSVQFPTV